MIAAELFKFNDCVEGEIKAVFVVSFLPKPVKCVTGLSSGSPIGSFNIPPPPPPRTAHDILTGSVKAVQRYTRVLIQ